MAINLPDLQPLGLKQVNTGVAPNDNQGDPIRTSFEKHNQNMVILNQQIPRKLVADVTYYVGTNGDDNNAGTVAAPFATIDKAVSTAYSINTAGYVVKIKILDGTYNQNISINASPNGLSHSNRIYLQIEGNLVNPDAVIVNIQDVNGYCIEVHHTASVSVKGIRFLLPNTTLTKKQYFLGVFNGALLQMGKCVFGSMAAASTDAAHIYVERGRFEIVDNYTVIGAAKAHITCIDGWVDVYNETGTAYLGTVNNQPAFTSWFIALGSSTIRMDNTKITYTGDVTGQTFIKDFDSRVTWNSNLPNGLIAGTINTASIGPASAETPPAGDNSTRIATTAWTKFYVDTRVDALEATLDAIGSGLTDAINGLGVIPKGGVIAFAGSAAPPGMLLCNGAAVSRNTYQDLFNVIGTTFGAGDGSTTFNVPDLRGRTIVGVGAGPGLLNYNLNQSGGAETHQLTPNEMPAHNHTYSDPGHTHAINDPGHTHVVYDPGHAHTFPGYTYDTDAGEGSDGNGSAYAPLSHPTYASGSNIALYGAATGVYNSASGVNLTINTSGASLAHNNMQPWRSLNYVIKY